MHSGGENQSSQNSAKGRQLHPIIAQDGVASSDSKSPNGWQQLIFTDPIAFRYLRDDPCTQIIERQVTLDGFELYLVEQWACSRAHPTFIINTFTGQPQHKVVAGVLSVPTDEKEWSPRLRLYLKAISTFHARRKDTPLGSIMVTNLSSFPSALTVIQIPDGDLKEHREMFIVNEDLKRLGCSGRAGLTLSAPSGATTTKFLQLYRTNEGLPVAIAVLELVKMCQVALVMFDKLDPEFADGLLCDVTERAISDWWAKIGTDYYSTEPTDGILGPTTVSAILGLYVGARNRLNAYGAPTAKDAFDIRSMKRAIGYFQRTNKLSGAKPRRLDLTTLQRLHRSTSKAAHHERWAVPRAVKSTVAEYGGKGGEMVIGMVGRDKKGIAEIETLDMQRFAEKVSGEHGRWLWHGKSRKGPPLDIFGAFGPEDESIFSADERGTSLGPFKKRDLGHENRANHPTKTEVIYTHPLLGSQSSLDTSDKDPALRRTVLRNVTGKMSDAKTGLGRFKDAVSIAGRRNHQTRHSRDVGIESWADHGGERLAIEAKDSSHVNYEQIDRGLTLEQSAPHAASLEKLHGRGLKLEDTGEQRKPDIHRGQQGARYEAVRRLSSESNHILSNDASGEYWHEDAKGTRDTVPELRPTRSIDGLFSPSSSVLLFREGLGLSRQMSTSDIESASTWLRTVERGMKPSTDELTASLAMADEQKVAIESQQAVTELQRMSEKMTLIVGKKLRELGDLEFHIRKEYDNLSQAYSERVRDHRVLQDGMSELLTEEEAFLTEAFKELEILGAKLEYEMGALVSKVEDVEDGAADFERQVEDLESRIEALGRVEVRKERWRPLRFLGI